MLSTVRGGVKVYRGAPAAARHYVEADRGRADDYYLADGTGIAQRYSASRDGAVTCEAPLTGDAYESWVAGIDPVTGEPKGRLRTDENAVRFLEVSVNGPKTWSLAAELHPDISAAYDAAQDAAAAQIIGWLAQHATTRVGPRGAQIQVAVDEIDAVTVRHYTSRAGDPHRHLHLQVNTRVHAEGRWRGLHTVAVRDSIDAINGIGQAAMMTDPGFRDALAAHGLSLDPGTGEVVQLREYVGAFSARAAQIGRHLDGYEAEWRAANPHAEPGPALRRAWDRRAWADARPDKVVSHDGSQLTSEWVGELHRLGYRDASTPVAVEASPIAVLDRDGAVVEVLSRLAARRSGWNAADIRGEVEQLIARANVVTDAPVRVELAEDLTARTLAECVPLLDRPGVPEHVRALTSRRVLDVETDLINRLTNRADAPRARATSIANDVFEGLDPVQRDVVSTLADGPGLVVIEGAAGAGKTTMLAAARAELERRGSALRVVTPTLKAARVAAQQVGGNASSAAWLVYQHGWRWDETGAWTRLRVGDVDSNTGTAYTGPRADAVLASEDVLLVDEAGMLDQDTAHALLIITDDHHMRVALVGDRQQLPAVGRGGVLDLAARHVHPDAQRELDCVHRFTRTQITPDGALNVVADEEYAALSLAMRAGDDPAAVFDALLARGQIWVHDSDGDRLTTLAQNVAQASRDRPPDAVVVDTNEQVAAVNHAVRSKLVAVGRVDDVRATHADGSAIGAGDRVVTRRNDADLDVANRDSWTVREVHRDGSITVAGEQGERSLPVEYVREHVQLGYATTVHGVQGDTTIAAHLAVGEHTSAASAYVGMTRGRERNTAHLVADNIDDARHQWVAVFARDRGDLGPAHAAQLAAQEADRYAALRPLAHVLGELRDAWTIEADARTRLTDAYRRRELLRDIVTTAEQRDTVVPSLHERHEQARAAAAGADRRLRAVETVVTARANELADTLCAAWDDQRGPARDAARIVREGSGRLGQRRAAVRDAREHLEQWAAAWQPYLPAMPHEPDQVVKFADWFDDTHRQHHTLTVYARTATELAHPDYLDARHTVQRTREAKTAASTELLHTYHHYSVALQHYGSLGNAENPAGRLAETEATIAADETSLAAARERIAAIQTEPTLRAQTAEVVELARADWQANRDHAAAAREQRWAAQADRERASIGPRGAGLGREIEIRHDAPDRGISR